MCVRVRRFVPFLFAPVRRSPPREVFRRCLFCVRRRDSFLACAAVCEAGIFPRQKMRDNGNRERLAVRRVD